MIYGPRNVRIHNNTLDGLGAASFRRPVFVEHGGDVVLRSNAIVGMPNAPAVQIDGTLDADYNLFSGQQGLPRNYSDGRAPAHDVGGANAQVDPRFAGAGEPFRYDWADVWTRRIGVRQILATYRARYTPAAGSPLADAGEPAEARIDGVFRAGFEAGEAMPTGGAGNDIGAVGSGLPADDDLFGR